MPFDTLYPSYSDSWRVTQDASLFSYATGQSTQTFTDRAFPDRSLSVTDLDATRREQAESVCRWAGIADAWQFVECVFDVAATGRSEFAISGATTELIAPPAGAPIAAKPISSGTLTAGSNDKLTFDARAGDAVFVDITAPTLPDQCSPYRLLDPTGKDIANGCNINGHGYIDRSELTVDGRYTLLVDAHEGDTGRATMRVYASHDTTGILQANGAPLSATIEYPGSVVRYRFIGTAGQRVFVDVPGSTLPDQCSPLELRDPAGKVLTSGCVINGSGEIEGTLLPTDGTYTVLVDARDRTIGTIQLSLWAAMDQNGTIAVDGSPVVATIGQPGLVVRYRFAGAAGMSVTLDATDATLADECSPIELRDPSDEILASGCVINGKGGIDRIVLPATGAYTIVVDPRAATTGTITLSLHR